MKKNRLYFIGQLIMIAGSLLYGIDLLFIERATEGGLGAIRTTGSIVLVIYLIAIVLMLAGRITGAKAEKN